MVLGYQTVRVPISRVFGKLWHCSDILPSDADRSLEDSGIQPKRRTYAAAARALLAIWAEAAASLACRCRPRGSGRWLPGGIVCRCTVVLGVTTLKPAAMKRSCSLWGCVLVLRESGRPDRRGRQFLAGRLLLIPSGHRDDPLPKSISKR